MEWNMIFKILGSVLFSVGGAGVIFWALSSWFGKVWANRILEGDRAKYNREIEGVKKDFNKELAYYKNQLELARTTLSRYSESQFNLYNKLWTSLCDLKIAGDKLWEKVDLDSLLDFSNQLRKTREYVMKGSLLIEDGHYDQLIALLDKFGDYEFGKKKLIEIRRENASANVYSQAIAEYTIAEDNKIQKQNYDSLLSRINSSFKKQLRGDFERITPSRTGAARN